MKIRAVVAVCVVVVVGVVGMVVVVAPILFRTLNMNVVTRVTSNSCLKVKSLCCG